jgi:hypothetical protein
MSSQPAIAPAAVADGRRGWYPGRLTLRGAPSGGWAVPPATFEAQGRFAAYVAHELRAPVALQRALVEVSLADPAADTTTLREMGERVIASCERQQRLIEALLDLTRGRSGPKRREPVDLPTITAAALRAHDLGRLERVVVLEPAWTTGDPGLLGRLVANLVSNAIHHNLSHGRIEIATRTESRRAVLSVSNTGPLIPPGELQRLFRPFQRLASDPTSAVEGSGLGLAIVQAIADAHNAFISARSRAGGGLEIHVSFPPTVHRRPAPRTASSRAGRPSLGEPEEKPMALRGAGNRSTGWRRQRALPIALAAVSCAVALAACGSSSPTKASGGPTGQGKLAGALAFSRCMRSHGVPNFPDPHVSGNSIQILGGGPGIDQQSPASSSARQSCEHLLASGVASRQQQIARQQAQLLRISRCMRSHAIPGFPDPTTSPPSSRAGYSAITSNGGAWLAIPNSVDVTSPAFQRAAAACTLGPVGTTAP